MLIYVCCLSVVLCHRLIYLLYFCLSPFPECSEAPLGEATIFLPSIGGASNTIKRLLFHSIVLLFLIEYQFDVVALLFVALLKQDYSQHFF